MEGFYTTLGLERGALDVDVRSAYRRQALATHPDKGGSAIAFRRIVQAFETLGDSVRRAAYDSRLAATGSNDGLHLKEEKTVKPSVCPQSQTSGQPAATAACVPTVPADLSAADGNVKFAPKRKEQPEGQQTEDRKKKRPAESRQEAHHVKFKDSNAQSSSAFVAPASASPQSHHGELSALCEELLGESRGTWDKRLSSMTADVLEKLIQYLDHELKKNGLRTEQGPKPSCGANTETGSEDEDVMPVSTGDTMAICDAISASEGSDSDGQRDSSVTQVPACLSICDVSEACTAAVSTQQNSGLMRGVIRNRRRTGSCDYHAIVGFESMVVLSRSVMRLEDAIDMHIALVRLRQLVRAGMEAGQDFQSVLPVAVEQIVEEQVRSGSLDLRLSFATRLYHTKSGKGRSDLYAPRTRNVETAISFWETMKTLGSKVAEDVWQSTVQQMKTQVQQERKDDKTQKAMRKTQLEEARKVQLQQQAEARRAMRKREKELRQQAVEAERREKKLEALERRQKLAAERQALKIWQSQRKALLARVKVVLKRLVCSEKQTIHRWGVQRLPPGLEVASLQDDGDSVCAVFHLSSGEEARGPLRSKLKDAQQDLLDLTHLRDSFGDAVACEELQRRDVEVMTSLFIRELAGRPAGQT